MLVVRARQEYRLEVGRIGIFYQVVNPAYNSMSYGFLVDAEARYKLDLPLISTASVRAKTPLLS